MFLSVDEVAAILGVSSKWVRDRLDAGDTSLSQLKCRKDATAPSNIDRSPVRVSASDLARYISANTREHSWASFPLNVPEENLEALERRIWSFVRWHRKEPNQPPA